MIKRKELVNIINKFDTCILKTNVKTCDVCGCYINPSMATKGKSYIITTNAPYRGFPDDVIESIYTPYYCKIHIPRKKTVARKDK